MTDDFVLPGQARSPLQQNGLPQASTGRVTYSPDRQTPRLNNAKDEDEELRELQEHRKPESTGKHVPTSHPHGDASSARRERPTSARRREPASSQLSPGKEKTETASKWQSKDEGSSSWQAAGPGGKDSAKEWLDKGQKWLFTAGKKVAAAAKEASSTIQSKLDEMEVFKSQSKGPRTWSPDDDDMIPEYYKEWAATIERLGPEEQARTLGQMTEDDRLVVQRIMDQSSVRRSTATRVSPTTSRPQQISGSENGARRAAPPRPPQRTHSAEALSQPSPPSRAASSGSVERPRRSASYNLGTAPSADESLDARPSGSAPATPERPAPAGTPSKPPVHSSPSPQKARPPPTVHKQADLLGLFGGEAQPEDDFMGAPSPQPAASSRGNSAADLFDMGDESSSRAPQSSAAQGQEEVDILGMFASAAPAASAEDGKPHERGAAATAAASKPAASGLDELFGAHKADASMIDFGDEEVSEASAASAVRFTAAGDIDVEGEPEMRRQARAKRLAEKQAQIRAALAEKQARDSAEAQEKERKVELREEYKQRMKAWQQGKDGNIRALLSSLDTVLWENSGWKKPAMTDLLEPQRVKRAYMKANLVVHPDKVKQKGGTVEQIVIADIAFDALKGAWAKFEAAELR
ncbi:g88 [Coccomyxa elongata]